MRPIDRNPADLNRAPNPRLARGRSAAVAGKKPRPTGQAALEAFDQALKMFKAGDFCGALKVPMQPGDHDVIATRITREIFGVAL